MKIGDLVRRKYDLITGPQDGRLGIVMSEVFVLRPTWEDEHPGVQVWTRHGHTNDLVFATWLLEDIEMISEIR